MEENGIKYGNRFIQLTLLLLFLVGSPLHAYIDYPYAVSFQTIREPLLPLDEEEPGLYQGSFRMSLRWANVWSIQNDRFIIDGEELQAEPSFRFQPAENLQVGVSLPFKYQGGGVLDHTIEEFHDLIGVSQSQRRSYPRNRWNVSYEPLGPFYGFIDRNPLLTYMRKYESRTYPRSPEDPPITLALPEELRETIVINHPARSGTGKPKLFAQYALFRGGSLVDSVVVGATLAYPLFGSDSHFSSSGRDISPFLVVKKRFLEERLLFKAGISYVKYGMMNYLYLKLPAQQWVFRPSLEYSQKEWSYIVEYVYYTAPVKNFGRLSRPGHQIALGANWKRGSYIFSTALVENLINYGNTPDIGFVTSLEYKNIPFL